MIYKYNKQYYRYRIEHILYYHYYEGVDSRTGTREDGEIEKVVRIWLIISNFLMGITAIIIITVYIYFLSPYIPFRLPDIVLW